jgi:hypothetical protein
VTYEKKEYGKLPLFSISLSGALFTSDVPPDLQHGETENKARVCMRGEDVRPEEEEEEEEEEGQGPPFISEHQQGTSAKRETCFVSASGSSSSAPTRTADRQ